MLLNISNHPSAEWPEAQLQAAKEQFGAVSDLTHPAIDPQADTDEVLQTAESYYLKVRKIAPHAVHIMGEQTFCYVLVRKLQHAGIPCYASTTRRQAVRLSDTEIRRTFEFVQFRAYPASVI